MTIVRETQIGGALVRRHFTGANGPMRVNSTLTRDEVLRMPTNNRQALIDGGYLTIIPLETAQAVAVNAPPMARFVISKGFKKYAVIEGLLLATGLTKEEAYALVEPTEAAEEPPPKAN